MVRSPLHDLAKSTIYINLFYGARLLCPRGNVSESEVLCFADRREENRIRQRNYRAKKKLEDKE